MRLPSAPWARDAIVAGALTVLAQVELVLAADQVSGPLLLQHVAFLVMTASVALRRTAPAAAAVVCAAGLALQTLAGDAPVVGGFLAMLVVVASLGYHASWRRGLLGLAALAGGVLLYDVLADRLVVADLLGNLAIMAGVWALAATVRRSTDARVAAEVAADRAAGEAVAAERRRIARDLHDSVAHGLTLMTLQAGTARERTDDPALVESLRTVEDVGRAALEDMHRFVQVLGPAPGDGEAPALRDLDDMVARVRSGGLDVELLRDGDLDAVPASVSSTAYRVVQEALTNTVRHAGASRATVAVRSDGRWVHVEVLDDGPGLAAPRTGGSGRGLAGLGERLALFGGAIESGRVAQGGWRVQATIPVTSGRP